MCLKFLTCAPRRKPLSYTRGIRFGRCFQSEGASFLTPGPNYLAEGLAFGDGVAIGRQPRRRVGNTADRGIRIKAGITDGSGALDERCDRENLLGGSNNEAGPCHEGVTFLTSIAIAPGDTA